MSRAEVAAQLGVEVGTVSAHRARGLRKLKSHAERIGLAALALYALVVFFFGSGLEFVLWQIFSEAPAGLAAMAIFYPGGYGHVAPREVGKRIQRIKASATRAWIMAFLACGMLAGTWCIWQFGLAADGLSVAEGLGKAAIAILCGLLLVLSVRGLGPGSVSETGAKPQRRE